MFSMFNRAAVAGALVLITAIGSFQMVRSITAGAEDRADRQPLSVPAAPLLEARRVISPTATLEWSELDEAPLLEARRVISPTQTLQWTDA